MVHQRPRARHNPPHFATAISGNEVLLQSLCKLHSPHFPACGQLTDASGKRGLDALWVDGVDLAQLSQKPSESRLVDWWWQLYDALAVWRDASGDVVHGDIKPANIVLRPSGKVCLIDFGSAHFSSTKHRSVTTKAYAAPELYYGISTPLADMFGLGATLLCLQTAGGFKAGLAYADICNTIEQSCQTVELQIILKSSLALEMSERAARLKMLEQTRKELISGFSKN